MQHMTKPDHKNIWHDQAITSNKKDQAKILAFSRNVTENILFLITFAFQQSLYFKVFKYSF